MKSLRHFAPRYTDRVNELCKNCTGAYIGLDASTIKNRKMYVDALHEIEKVCMQNEGFNFMMSNLPSVEQGEPVDFPRVHTTIEPLGDVEKGLLIRGTAYVKFVDPQVAEEAHKLLNGMQISDNIIQTTYCT